MRRGVTFITTFLIASLVAYSSGIDAFLAHYSSGNVHTLLYTNPVDLIELLGEEPAKYKYYSAQQYIFTYIDSDLRSSVQALSIIWTIGSIEEIRLSFATRPTIDEVLGFLGYVENFFDEQASTEMRLGYVPYRAHKFTARGKVKGPFGLPHDVIFVFLLNHFDSTVKILIIQHS